MMFFTTDLIYWVVILLNLFSCLLLTWKNDEEKSSQKYITISAILNFVVAVFLFIMIGLQSE